MAMLIKDLTGKTYGHWTVLGRHGHTKDGKLTWLCRCTCGNERVVPGKRLRRGQSRSCGHKGQRVDNLISERFGRHTVIARAEDHPRYGASWLCRCDDCGEERIVTGGHLRSGRRQGAQLKCSCRPTLRALPEGHAAFNALFNKWKRRALKERQSVPWEITKEEVWELIQQPCHYCGCEPHHTWGMKTGNGQITYNGLDRVDSLRGYVEDNVVPCCGTCNKAKQTMSVQEFRDWICRVHGHWASKGES